MADAGGDAHNTRRRTAEADRRNLRGVERREAHLSRMLANTRPHPLGHLDVSNPPRLMSNAGDADPERDHSPPVARAANVATWDLSPTALVALCGGGETNPLGRRNGAAPWDMFHGATHQESSRCNDFGMCLCVCVPITTPSRLTLL